MFDFLDHNTVTTRFTTNEMDNRQRQPSSAWLERVLDKLIDNTIGGDVVEEDKEILLEELWELVTRYGNTCHV